ncbi:N-6 DNA methylase [Haloarcula litorea]|uniref:N-6 DNA methylase n=1 Tax=Haloarcula litorea TaxID=3032579 RepID=UPI0023E79CC8|nr:N-6 DNA methylase [Halomicroarcula sp. GDY20]
MFEDFLDLSLYALQRDDESYLDVMDKYGEEEAELYSEAFDELLNASESANHDVLGVVYEELGQSSDHFGQHFTPHNLSDMNAEMVIDEDPDPDREDPYSVLDPAAGSGRLLISAAKQLPDEAEAEFYAVDKDSTVAKMAALNLTFFNMDGYVVHGDSLTQDYHRVWATKGSVFGGSVYELDDDQWTNPYDQEVSEEPTGDDVDEDLAEGTQEDPDESGRVDAPDIDFEEVRETKLSAFAEEGDSQ